MNKNKLSHDQDLELHNKCEVWSEWARTRKFFAQPPASQNMLAKLSSKTRPVVHVGGPDAICSAELSALHVAIISQPKEALDRVVFECHYVLRLSNIKASAAAIGVSRQHYYRMLKEFRRRIDQASKQILLDRQQVKPSNEAD